MKIIKAYIGGDTGDHSDPMTGKLFALTNIAIIAGKHVKA